MYKKLFAGALVVFLCCASAALAEERKGSTLADWLKGIQKKIDRIVPKKTLPVTNSVAGVRGAKEEASSKLYWKGKKGSELVTEEEMTAFKEGIGYAANGDKDGAVRKLEEFMKQYPDSALIPDAKKTLDLVKAEPNPPSASPAAGHAPVPAPASAPAAAPAPALNPAQPN